MTDPLDEHTRLAREFWHVAGSNNVEQIEQLLAKGADVNAADRTGVTALMRAAYHGQLTMVRALIEHGADPNVTDRGGLTALKMAKHAGHQEIVDALLSSGALVAKAKPRLVGSVMDETVGAVKGQKPAKRSIRDETVSPAERQAPPSTSQVRALHEPPEIWDLVHTTQPESDAPAIAKWHGRPAREITRKMRVPRFSTRTLAMGAGAVIICAGVVLGLQALRGVWTGDDKREQRVEATASEPISSSQPLAAKGLTDETGRIPRAAKELTKVTSVGKLTGVRMLPPTSPVTASATMSIKESSVRERTNATPPFSSQNRNVRKTTRPETDQASNSRPARKEQTSPPSDPVKPSVTQKPKVIQWP